MSNSRIALITGGAGFIGSNLAARLLRKPDVSVRLFDNFSRRGVRQNVDWLRSIGPAARLEVIQGDVRSAEQVMHAAGGVSDIYHFAAQVAVTTSVEYPQTDFEVNCHGTLNVLEAARKSGRKPLVLFTSTNKVYGSLPGLHVRKGISSYIAADPNFKGISEAAPLDFHSPYGCSKGAADQYVRDYARIYGLQTIVFRMSCIAGARQFGNEDQGWVAHFLYSVLAGRPVSIYGDGMQVRDVLHIEDLIDAMESATSRSQRMQGEIFNLGGGMERSVSVIEMLDRIARLTGKLCQLRRCPVRPGDQPLYIADTTKLQELTGWRARRSLDETLRDIHNFWVQNRAAIDRISSVSLPAPEVESDEHLREGVA